MNRKIAMIYINYLKQNFFYSDEKLLEIEYVFRAILSELEKIIMLLLIFLGLNSLYQFIICMIVLLPIRIFSGGLHFKNFWSCFIFSLIFFLSGIVLLPTINISDFGYILISCLNITICLLLSPSKSKTRPLKTNKEDTKYKAYVTIANVVILSLVFILRKSNNPVFWIITLQNTQLLMKGLKYYYDENVSVKQNDFKVI